MSTSHIIRALSVLFLAGVLAGCSFLFGVHSHDKNMGRIDLSARAANCESVSKWNSYNPGFVLLLSDTNGAARPFGANPDWALVMRLDVIDKSTGKLVATCRIAKEQIEFANWYVPATCLLLRTPKLDGILQADHSYKFVLTVLQEEKNFGSAKVFMHWLTNTGA
jgi:hypothetical protein